MIMASRRTMLAWAGGMMAAGAMGGQARAATPLGLPAGLQLWTVKEELAKDFEGTLRALKAIGYQRVETAGLLGRTPAQFKAALDTAGLEAFSSHYSLGDLRTDTEAKLTAVREIGVKFCVASSPYVPRTMATDKPWVNAMADAMTLADWRMNAEEMNRIGAVAKSVGVRFGYHNHAAEFVTYDGVEAFAEMVRMTDPELVDLELDLGWVAIAGYDPAEMLTRYKDRVSLLHVKDMRTRERTPGVIATDQQSVPVGQGSIDWPAVFRAAQGRKVQSYFVEQEPPFAHPPLEGLQASLTYLAGIA